MQFSVYNFERADVDKAWEHLRLYESECQALLDDYIAQFAERDSKRSGKGKNASGDSGERQMANGEERSGAERVADRKRFPVLGAFDLCLKCSHLFNILDARGAISVTERVGVIARIRALAVGVAKAYVDQQQAEAQSAAEADTRVEQLAASN